MVRIRAGIIGLGAMGRAHLEAIRRLGYAAVSALVVRDEDRAREAAERLNVPRFYTDYRELLRDPEVDVVHNCTPNSAHYPINRDTLKAGKHVLSEKPLAITAEQAGELTALAAKGRLGNAVNFVYRHFPVIRLARGMIERGELGEIYAVHGSYLQDWLLLETDYNWRVDPEQSGPSRAVADIGSHWCDMAMHLLGDEIIELAADLATFVPRRVLPAGSQGRGERVPVATEDFGSVLLRFQRGARGCFTVSQVSAGRKSEFSLEIDGSRASLFWNQEEAHRLWIGHRNEPNGCLVEHPQLLSGEAVSRDEYPAGSRSRWPDAQKDMIDSFYRSILDGEKSRFATFADACRVVRVVEAALLSHSTRSWQRVGGPAR